MIQVLPPMLIAITDAEWMQPLECNKHESNTNIFYVIEKV